MIVLVKANILAIGITGRSEVLRTLPVRVIDMQCSQEAGSSLKTEEIDTIISHWDLPDAADGRFLKALRRAKPHMPIIALVAPGDIGREIAARSIGVTAVVSSDVSDAYFRSVIAEVLGIDDVESIRNICAVADEAQSADHVR